VIDIVKLEPGDRSDWQAMFTEFLRWQWPIGRFDHTWSRLLDDAEVHAFGARVDGTLVGFVHFFRHAHTNAADVCCVHHLFTSPEWRGRGVARALVAAVANWAREHDCFRLYWVVQEENAAARRLYDDIAAFEGFIEYRMPIAPDGPAIAPPPEIDVGRLTASDRTRWESLFRSYIDFYERELPDAEYDRAWARLQDDDTIHAFGARTDGELVGIVHFMTHPHTNGLDVCYLQDLFTDVDVRGRGVGRALIAAVADWARSRGCDRVYWATQDSNTSARHLYDQVAEYDGFLIYRMPV
jgi:GNAT superfamily N-acetyltransferase